MQYIVYLPEALKAEQLDLFGGPATPVGPKTKLAPAARGLHLEQRQVGGAHPHMQGVWTQLKTADEHTARAAHHGAEAKRHPRKSPEWVYHELAKDNHTTAARSVGVGQPDWEAHALAGVKKVEGDPAGTMGQIRDHMENAAFHLRMKESHDGMAAAPGVTARAKKAHKEAAASHDFAADAHEGAKWLKESEREDAATASTQAQEATEAAYRASEVKPKAPPSARAADAKPAQPARKEAPSKSEAADAARKALWAPPSAEENAESAAREHRRAQAARHVLASNEAHAKGHIKERDLHRHAAELHESAHPSAEQASSRADSLTKIARGTRPETTQNALGTTTIMPDGSVAFTGAKHDHGNEAFVRDIHNHLESVGAKGRAELESDGSARVHLRSAPFKFYNNTQADWSQQAKASIVDPIAAIARQHSKSAHAPGLEGIRLASFRTPNGAM